MMIVFCIMALIVPKALAKEKSSEVSCIFGFLQCFPNLTVELKCRQVITNRVKLVSSLKSLLIKISR